MKMEGKGVKKRGSAQGAKMVAGSKRKLSVKMGKSNEEVKLSERRKVRT
jgi:hypothetical protein